MKKKKKIVRIGITLLFFVLILLCLIRFYSKGHIETYYFKDKEIEVKETYTRKEKGELDNYYIEITYDNKIFSFQFLHTFKEKRKIVEDVMYYDGDYTCVLPIIEGKAITDIMCYKDKVYYPYASIVGKDIELDKFADDISNDIYDTEYWISGYNKEFTNIDGIKVGTYNEDHAVAITNLKGIYLLENNKLNDITLFSKDQYERPLSAFVDDYYICADYDSKNQFREFYIVDITNGKKKTVKAPNYVSFDSYIQGVVDNKLYIYDRDNEKQYKIDLKEGSIKEVGNSKKKIQYYDNGDWDKISVTKANKKEYFKDEIPKELNKFDNVKHIGGKKSGYYYFTLENKLFRSPSMNTNIKMYVGDIDNSYQIMLVDDYIYFKNKDKIYCYQEEIGLREIIKYDEFYFNDNIIFGVTKK